MLAKVEPVYKEIEGVFEELEKIKFMKVIRYNKRKYPDDGEVLEFGLKSVDTTCKHVDSASLSFNPCPSPSLKAKKRVKQVKEKAKKPPKRKKRTKATKPRKKLKTDSLITS